jgi:O-antigen ligase
MTRGLGTLASYPIMMGGVVFFFAYIDFYLSEAGALPTSSTYVFLAALAAWAAVTVIRCLGSFEAKAELMSLYANHAGVLGALLAIVCCSLLFALLPTAYWNDGPMYLLYPAYDALIIVLSMLLAFHPFHRAHFREYLVGALVVLAASVVYDALYPGTFSFLPDRAAGFAENPNTTAFVLVLLCAAIVDLNRFRASDALVWALTGIGVFLTLSRGGGILLAYAFAHYTYRIVRLNAHDPVRWVRRAVVLAAIVALVYGAARLLVDRAEMFALSFQPRLGMFSGREDVLSADDTRIEALAAAVDLVKQSPVIGYGTGYSYSMLSLTPHNMYLQQWINNGLPGLAAYLSLLAMSALTFWRRRSARGVLFIALVAINGVFSHNILDERAFLALLGVLLSLSFYDFYDLYQRSSTSVSNRGRREPCAA